jgi:hypothetical protein
MANRLTYTDADRHAEFDAYLRSLSGPLKEKMMTEGDGMLHGR